MYVLQSRWDHIKRLAGLNHHPLQRHFSNRARLSTGIQMGASEMCALNVNNHNLIRLDFHLVFGFGFCAFGLSFTSFIVIVCL